MKASLVRGEPGALDLHSTEGTDRNLSVRQPAPRAAPVLQLQHLVGCLFDEELHRVLIA